MKHMDASELVTTYKQARADIHDVASNIMMFGQCKCERSWFANSERKGEYRELTVVYDGTAWLVKKLNGCVTDIELLP